MNLRQELNKLDKKDLSIELEKSLIIAMDRTDSKLLNSKNTIDDIIEKFSKKKLCDVLDGIKQGGLGEYGIVYKITTQSVCYWINQYLNEKYKLKKERL